MKTQAQNLYDMAVRGEKIQAIKRLRELTNHLGLKEAKDVIDSAVARGSVGPIRHALGEPPATEVNVKVEAEVVVEGVHKVTATLDGERVTIRSHGNLAGVGFIAYFDADALETLIDALCVLRDVRNPPYNGPMA